MCGILGFSLKAGRVLAPECLNAALSDIRHRGPDASHSVFSDDGRIGLGHARLSIIELSEAGAQPMTTPQGSHTIAYNGELYDFQGLAQSLAARGVNYAGHSDTEVLLNALVLDGIDCIRDLNGMFAFALWDRNSNSITLARDGFGIKPLYIAETEMGVFFASEVRALIRMGVVPQSPDGQETSRYLHNLWNQAGRLPSANLWKLAPGEAMVIQGGEISRRWVWDAPAHLSPAHQKQPLADTAKNVASLLRQSVERQLVSDVPVGAFLSGGLDSSAIVAFAKESVPNIACFSIETSGGTEEGTEDDLPYAHRVAKHLNVPLHIVKIDQTQMMDDLYAMIAQLEEPIADPACLNAFYISKLARENGIKVLLSGAGGDDLFTGYRRHIALKWDRYLGKVPQSIRKLMVAAATQFDSKRPVTRRLKKLLEGAELSGDDRLMNFFAWSNDDLLVNLLSPDTRRAVHMSEIDDPMREYLQRVSENADAMDRMLALEQRFFLGEHNLIYTDKMSMAAGVEVRVPFLDPDLARLASTIPSNVKQRGNVGKWILKKAMQPYLPHDVIYRPKTGFGAPLRSWIHGDLSGVMDDILSEASIKARGIFDAPSIQRLRKDTISGSRDGSYTLFSAMCIEIWARIFIDGRKTQTLSQKYMHFDTGLPAKG